MQKRRYLLMLATLLVVTVVYAGAREHARQMHPGWNLGNTLEATEGETGWQDTRTTQKIIDFVKAQGFRSVRIPCAWNIHCDAQRRIDPAWLSRVQEIVRYCLNDGLYVVLNDHWDGGWIEVEGFSSSTKTFQPVTEEIVTDKILRLVDLWTQIAIAFRDFDDHLLFSGLNEPFQQYNLFNGRHQELTPILMRYNQTFVNTVRATGGRNAQRTLIIQTPSTSIASATDPAVAFSVPTDMAGADHLMVEVHYYEPWNFCGQEDGGAWFWGKDNLVEGDDHNSSWSDEAHMERMMQALDDKFVSRGYPVIIGECGANWRQLPHHQAQHDASIRYWYSELNRRAVNHGCVTMLWDINVPDRKGDHGTFTVIDRQHLQVFNPIALEGILAGTAAGKWPY